RRISLRWLFGRIGVKQRNHSRNVQTAFHPLDLILKSLIALPGPQVILENLDCPLLLSSHRTVNNSVASAAKPFVYGPSLQDMPFPILSRHSYTYPLVTPGA